MAAYVAQTKEKLRDSTSNKNPNYPDGVKDAEVGTQFLAKGLFTIYVYSFFLLFWPPTYPLFTIVYIWPTTYLL